MRRTLPSALLCASLALPNSAAAIECRHAPDEKGSWSWREVDGQRCWYKGRRVIPKDQLQWARQARVAADIPPQQQAGSSLERASDKAPAAEIYFLSTVNGRSGALEAYPTLVWRQPWLSPESVMQWPLLIDIDRVPFTEWTKRIGQ